ncbi:lipid II flippase MurJ [Methylobacterium sp. JK268]
MSGSRSCGPAAVAPGAADAPASSRRFVAVLMGGAALSKLLGVVREVAMAHLLGVTLAADAFRAGMTAVMLPLAFLQNESVPALLVPLYRRWHEAGEAPRRFAALAAAVTLIGAALAVCLAVLVSVWIEAMVGGFAPEAQALTRHFARILTLAMPAMALLNSLTAAELALGRPRLMTLRPLALNLSILTGLALIALTGAVSCLAWAVVAAFGGLAGLGVVWLVREGVLDLAGLRPAEIWAAGRYFLGAVRPLLSVPVAEQGSLWLERVLGSHMAAGTVAAMDYVRTLTDSAMLLISQPVGLATLSRGTGRDAGGEAERIARPILAVMLPASVFLFAFADEITRFVFARGAFDAKAILLTGQGLAGVAPGLWASTLGWILLRLLNGAGRNTAAAGILCGSYAANALANLLLVLPAGVPDLGTHLLGLAESVRSLVLLAGTALLLGCARRIAGLVLRALGPALLMGLLAWLIRDFVPGSLARLLCGAGACTATVALGLPHLLPVLRSVKSKV